jgi:hypothetical protein
LAWNLIGFLVKDLVDALDRGRLSSGQGFAANLGIGVAGSLPLSRGVGFGDLAFFASGGGFGDGGGFGAASGFDTFGCCGADGLFCFAQSAAHRGVGVFGLMGACGLGGLTCGGLRCSGGGFGFCLGEQCLLTNLFSSAMSQLRAILAAGGGEVTIFCPVEICPRVEDSHIFGSLCYYRFVDLVRAARIHFPVPVYLVTLALLELRRFAASSIRRVCTRYHAIS